jgi:bifunctional UDP-N-acetylglucosamine pyrophosphorylase/glucosamine-1-phosphate N-acetyltransferase
MGATAPKVLLPIHGRPLLAYVLDAVRGAGANRIVIVVGVAREAVMTLPEAAGVEFAVQAEPRGTADAVLACRGMVGPDEECVVVYGDVPLMRDETIRRLAEVRQAGTDVAVLTAVLDNPYGYGRVVRGDGDTIERITEERDATDEVRRIREVNSGFYAFRWGRILPVLERIKPSPVSGEYYLTDAVREVRSEGGRVAAVLMADPVEMLGANTPEQLDEVAAEMTRRTAVARQ